jgi:uncharacterized RDD family membrane protein YckC
MPDNNNPYQTPGSPFQSEPPAQRSRINLEPASRGSRLLAALLDGVVTMIVVLPVMYYIGLFERGDDLGGQVTAFLLGFISVIIIHGYLLHTRGQSIGKAIVGIQIVGLDGHRISLAQIIFRRYLPIQLASLIPGFGSVLTLLDAVWIFREDRRCIHDHLAGTVVVAYMPDA